MHKITNIINEEIMTTVANLPQFGDRLQSINEFGDGVDGYPFKLDNVGLNELNYYFDTPENEYIVLINRVDVYKEIWEMQFGTTGGTPDEVTNEGQPIKIMSTIVLIMKEFINKNKPNVIKVKPTKNNDNDMRRHNLYMAYIKKNMQQDYMVYSYGEYIVIERKIKRTNNIPKI